MNKSNSSSMVHIVSYQPEYQMAFERLNLEWLEKWFEVEAIDRKILLNPHSYIIEKGGQIFFAILNEEVVGTAALIVADNDSYELSKMSVTENCQGKGIGRLLAMHAIDYFKRSNRTVLFLESNSRLTPALKLYQSLGFEFSEHPNGQSPYQRADVYMIYRGKSNPTDT